MEDIREYYVVASNLENVKRILKTNEGIFSEYNTPDAIKYGKQLLQDVFPFYNPNKGDNNLEIVFYLPLKIYLLELPFNGKVYDIPHEEIILSHMIDFLQERKYDVDTYPYGIVISKEKPYFNLEISIGWKNDNDKHIASLTISPQYKAYIEMIKRKSTREALKQANSDILRCANELMHIFKEHYTL